MWALRVASLVSLAAISGRAAASESVAKIEGGSLCPSPAQVVRELLPLLGEVSVPAESFAQLKIDDLGASYRVSVGQVQRLVEDSRRDCAERAKVSAVFIALNLPLPREPSTPQTVSPPPVEAPARVDAAAPLWRLQLRAVAGVEHAPEVGKVATGLTLGSALRRGQLAITLSAGAQTPIAIAAGDDEASAYELWRLPASLSLGYVGSAEPLSFGLEGGLALDALRFRGLSVPGPETATRFNAGLRLSLPMRLRASRSLAALLTPTFAYYPRTYLVRLEPTRLLGESPRFWWGVGVGLECSLLGG